MRAALLAILAIGLLAWSVDAGQPAAIHLRDAAHHEGRLVIVHASVTEAWPRSDGSATVHLTQEGHGLTAFAPHDLPRGATVQATGRLVRLGDLVLDIQGLEMVQPTAARPTWSQLSHDPASWLGHSITITGTVRGGVLHGDGAALRLGEPQDPGHTTVTGVFAYANDCICYVLWTGPRGLSSS